MKRQETDLFWIHVYIILTAVAFTLFAINGNEIAYFMGASSIVQAFLFGVAAEHGLLSVLGLIWALVCTVGLIWFYLLSVTKRKTRPFFVITALDLGISFALGIWCVVLWKMESIKCFTILLGSAVRVLFYLLMLRQTKESQTGADHPSHRGLAQG